MIDTHAHVHVRAYDGDREAVLQRAFDAGVTAVVEINIDRAGWPRALACAHIDPRVFLTAGIHPHDAGAAGHGDLDGLFAHLDDPKVRGIGETGLDYYRDYAPHDVQRELFSRHVVAARETGLPLVVHSRQREGGPSAHADTLRILEEVGRGQVRGVFHCFSGDLPMAAKARSMGFLLGIGGAVTYNPKRSGPLLASIAERLGPEVFILETDCPYLTPHPRRNDRNEPANIPAIAAELARYLGMTPAEIEAVTDRSARGLFGLPEPSGSGPGA